MFLKSVNIQDDSLVTDIVIQDYRTAEVFSRHGIDFCCGGRRSLQEVCLHIGIECGQLKKELNESLRTISVANTLDFQNWDIDFLIDYICNVHHQYLRANLPIAESVLKVFAEGHKKKFTYLPALVECVMELKNELIPHIDHEEKIVFPYIKHISHAYKNKETYSALLVRTLRKPIEHLVKHDHEHVSSYLHRIRELTDNYTTPTNACVRHKVTFRKLRELDDDLVHHVHLENNILFPRAISLEKEMLGSA